MKYHIIQRKILVFFIFLSLMAWGNISAQAPEKKQKAIAVKMTVTDENGTSLPSAQIVVGEGLIHAQTDANGILSFEARANELVTVTLTGFEKRVLSVSALAKENVLVLKKAVLFKTSEDVISLPFNKNYRRNTTGGYYTLTSSQLEKYPSTDLRNAFAGLVPGLNVVEQDGSTGILAQETLGSYNTIPRVAVSSRGFSPIYIIDGVPVHITEMTLDPQEIESFTLVTDIVGKAMYGAEAADGAIVITTKRGRKNDRILNVDIEKGVSTIDRFPEVVSGADYARLNNKARTNDGMSPVYTDEMIAGYEKNDAYDKVFPSANFRDLMLKNSKSFQRVGLSSTGGNDNVQYYAYLGYTGEGDVYKIGPDADYQRINARSNIDATLNKYFKVNFDFYAGISLRRQPNYLYNGNYTSEDGGSNTSLRLQEFTQVIDQINSIPPVAFPIYAAFDSISGTPWYGVHPNYGNNPVGDLVDCGYFTETGRTGSGKVALEYNMSHLIPGLKSRSDVAFNLYNLTRIGKAENYTAYIVNPSVMTDEWGNPVLDANGNKQYETNLTFNQLGVEMPGRVKMYDYYTQRLAFTQQFAFERSFGKSDIQSSLNYYISKYIRNGVEEPMRQQNLLWTGMYTFRNKYALQSSMAYNGSSSFAKGKRYKLFPAVGASWVVSDEGFMQGTSHWLNFLKFRAEYGHIGYDNLLWSRQYYMTADRWTTSTGQAFGPHTSNRWFGNNIDSDGSYRTSYNRIGNNNLTWETRKELSAGFDMLMLNNRLSLAVTYYNILRDDIVIYLEDNYFPLTAGYQAYPYYNYAKTRHYGAELGLMFTNRIGNDFRYAIGGNAAYQNTNRIKVYELPYANAYQSRQGTPVDSYYGFEYLGRFQSDEETGVVQQLFDEQLYKGDMKYADLNGDGVVDSNDQKKIGNTSPRLIYGINLNLAYKRFDLTVVANGRAFCDVPLTTRYYQNGWGDNNYSKFVLDNADGNGEYPRLAYNRVTNNFQPSGFWMRNGGYFKIQNVELGYNMKLNPANRMALRGVRLFARGANLLTISEIKDSDPESMQAGVLLYPLYRTVTGGVKFMF